jgi:hypothetical protein
MLVSKADRARDRARIPGHLPLPLRIEQIPVGARRALLRHQRGVDAGREDIEQECVPVALRVLELGRIAAGVGGRIGRQQARALKWNHVGDAVEHVGLDAAGHALFEDLGRGRRLVGATELQLDAGIFLFERRFERTDSLVHDQGRVPDDLAFLPGALDHRGIGGHGLSACNQGKRDRDDESRSVHGAPLRSRLATTAPSLEAKTPASAPQWPARAATFRAAAAAGK